jgi:hypothetical protein
MGGCAPNIVVDDALSPFGHCWAEFVFDVAVRCDQQRWRALCGQWAEAYCITTLAGRVHRRGLPSMTLDSCG